MARYKHIDTSSRFLAVDLERQLLPGTFEHTLCRLIDLEIDLSAFDARYCNDLNGATAYPPAMLLKVRPHVSGSQTCSIHSCRVPSRNTLQIGRARGGSRSR